MKRGCFSLNLLKLVYELSSSATLARFPGLGVVCGQWLRSFVRTESVGQRQRAAQDLGLDTAFPVRPHALVTRTHAAAALLSGVARLNCQNTALVISSSCLNSTSTGGVSFALRKTARSPQRKASWRTCFLSTGPPLGLYSPPQSTFCLRPASWLAFLFILLCCLYAALVLRASQLLPTWSLQNASLSPLSCG